MAAPKTPLLYYHIPMFSNVNSKYILICAYINVIAYKCMYNKLQGNIQKYVLYIYMHYICFDVPMTAGHPV